MLQNSFRVIVCLAAGFAYIPLMMFAAMVIFSRGGDSFGEGMMGGLFAFFTFPFVSIGTWLLYPRKAFRIAIYCLTLLGLIPFITTTIMLIIDLRTPISW